MNSTAPAAGMGQASGRARTSPYTQKPMALSSTQLTSNPLAWSAKKSPRVVVERPSSRSMTSSL